MEMDGLDSVKCQKSRRWDINGIFEMLMIIRQKMNSVIFFILSTTWAVDGRVDAVGVRFEF